MLKGTVLIFLLPIYIIVLIIGVKRKFSLSKHLYILALYLYIMAVLAVTLFPIPFQKNLIKDMQASNYLKNNFIPFKSISEMLQQHNISTFLRQILGNILLFAPLGFFVPLIFKNISRFRSILVIGIVSSVGIELLQLMLSSILGITYKVTDIDDIILNTIGAISGFIILRLFLILTENEKAVSPKELNA